MSSRLNKSTCLGIACRRNSLDKWMKEIVFLIFSYLYSLDWNSEFSFVMLISLKTWTEKKKSSRWMNSSTHIHEGRQETKNKRTKRHSAMNHWKWFENKTSGMIAHTVSSADVSFSFVIGVPIWHASIEQKNNCVDLGSLHCILGCLSQG